MNAPVRDTEDLRGQRIAITGANTGIGRAAALELARRGARLVLLGRSAARTQPVLDEIGQLPGAAPPLFVPLDLGDLASVRAAAGQLLEGDEPLAVLINNAGLAGARALTADGSEPAFGTNHLGHFLLTTLLLDRLRASAPARIVTVSSRAHERPRGIDFEALRQPPRSRTGFAEYATSKLCNVLFTKELARRLDGTGVAAYALHPGVVASDIWRRVPAPVRGIMKLFMVSTEQGAKTLLLCATAPTDRLRSGAYYDGGKERRPSRTAEDEALAGRLWQASEAWVTNAGR